MSDIGVKNPRKIWGFQILNVGQIFVEKSQKKTQRRLILKIFLITIFAKC